MVLPFRVTMLYSGPSPLTEIVLPSTLLLSIPIPGSLASDSAKFPSGNLPISSAVMISVTPTLFLLISSASISACFTPVTITSSTSTSADSSA